MVCEELSLQQQDRLGRERHKDRFYFGEKLAEPDFLVACKERMRVPCLCLERGFRD